MIEKVTITRISSTNQKKDGTMLISKYGKEYFRIGLQTEEHGEEWLNGFSNSTPDYEVGDKIEIEVTTEEWQGKEQLKFRIPKKDALCANCKGLLESEDKAPTLTTGVATKEESVTEDKTDGEDDIGF